MKKELNYLSEKIEKIEQRVSHFEKMPKLKNSLGLQHILKYRKEELNMLKNILNKLTEINLTNSTAKDCKMCRVLITKTK